MTSTASYYGFIYTIFGLGASHMGLIPSSGDGCCILASLNLRRNKEVFLSVRKNSSCGPLEIQLKHHARNVSVTLKCNICQTKG
jgi:hypothetical protein